jgi:hypothetical protein
MRDYCARNDLACQAGPRSTVDGHTSYFTNSMRADGAAFVLERLAARRQHTPGSSRQPAAMTTGLVW